jgi:glycosyltransferase involved in cell wall biosynthesis
LCIATLNRASALRVCLDSLLPQATDDVEIVIVDGASHDNTEEVVHRCQQEFAGLRYFRQPVNGGVDRDYSLAVELAQGEYCWLMTDDDVLLPGAIQAVLAAIPNNHSLIVANAEVRTPDLLETLTPRLLTLDADRVYSPSDCEEFFVKTASHLSYIAMVVIRRQLWLDRRKDEYFGTFFVHIGVIFQAPLPNSVLVIAQPLIAKRTGPSVWTPRGFEVWMFRWPELVWSFDFTEDAKRRVSAHEPWRKLTRLVRYRAKGSYALPQYRSWLAPRMNVGLERLAAWLVSIIPLCLANFISVVYYTYSKKRSCEELINLKASPYYFANCLRRRLDGNIPSRGH